MKKLLFPILFLCATLGLRAEDGHQLWLRPHAAVLGANLIGAANALIFNYTPQAAGILQFDFPAANQVTLKAGHRYTLELQGAAKSAPLGG
jgi:hypothetical protein